MKGKGGQEPEPEPDLWNTDKTDKTTFIRRMGIAYGPMQDFGELWEQLKAQRDAARTSNPSNPRAEPLNGSAHDRA